MISPKNWGGHSFKCSCIHLFKYLFILSHSHMPTLSHPHTYTLHIPTQMTTATRHSDQLLWGCGYHADEEAAISFLPVIWRNDVEVRTCTIHDVTGDSDVLVLCPDNTHTVTQASFFESINNNVYTLTIFHKPKRI